MPETKYEIEYNIVKDSRAIQSFDRMLAKARELDAALARLVGRMSRVGSNQAGIAKGVAGLKTLQSQAGTTEKSLAGVGKGNSNLSGYATRVGKSTERLKEAKAADDEAAKSMAGVGSGGPAGGRAGGGAGGGAGSGGKRSAGIAPAVGMTLAGMAMRVPGLVGESISGRREYLGSAGEKAAAFREDLREYTSLRNDPDANDKTVREALDLGARDNLLPGEIVPFLATYESSAATGRMAGNIGGSVEKGEITAEKQQQLEQEMKVVSAQFGTRTGIEAQTMGDLAGVAST